MKNKSSIAALFIAGIVCGFLIFEWFTPTNSLGILVLVVVLSVIGLVLSVYSLRREKSFMRKTALIIGAIISGLMILIFAVMLIMGFGA